MIAISTIFIFRISHESLYQEYLQLQTQNQSQMLKKSCSDCNYQFSGVSTKYYCHDRSQPVCVMCKRKECATCSQPRNKTIESFRCKNCNKRQLNQDSMFYEFKCQSYFCPQCLSKCVSKKNFTVLPCAHQAPNQDILTFMRQFCCKCGKKYEKAIDHQLLDYRKVCYRCYNKRDFKQDLIRCNVCNQVIRNTDSAGQANQNFVLCKHCYQQSTLQQVNLDNHASKINKLKRQQKPKNEQEIQRRQEQQKSFENHSNIKKPKQQQAMQKLVIQSKKEIIVQNDSRQPGINLDSQDIKLNKPSLIKKIQQDYVDEIALTDKNIKLKQASLIKSKQKIVQSKQNYSHGSPRSIEKGIKNGFQGMPALNKFDYSITQIEQEDGHHLKMKKYFSSQTNIEKYKIDVKKDNLEDQYCECQNCGYQIQIKDTLTYDKMTLCRLCFMIKNASSGNHLGFSSYRDIDTGFARGKPLTTAKFTSPSMNSPTKKSELKDNWMSQTQTDSKNFLLNKLQKQKFEVSGKNEDIKRQSIQLKKQLQFFTTENTYKNNEPLKHDKKDNLKAQKNQQNKQLYVSTIPTKYTRYESFKPSTTKKQQYKYLTHCEQCKQITRSYYPIKGKKLCEKCYKKQRGY